jgi:hypothetical protein
MHARKKGPEPGSVYTQSEAMKDIFARCHKKTDVQVCTLTIIYYCSVTVNIQAIATYATFLRSAIFISMYVQECDCNINRCLFFYRLKINHDTHEFILFSGTIANTNSFRQKTGHSSNWAESFGVVILNYFLKYYILCFYFYHILLKKLFMTLCKVFYFGNFLVVLCK